MWTVIAAAAVVVLVTAAAVITCAGVAFVIRSVTAGSDVFPPVFLAGAAAEWLLAVAVTLVGGYAVALVLCAVAVVFLVVQHVADIPYGDGRGNRVR